MLRISLEKVYDGFTSLSFISTFILPRLSFTRLTFRCGLCNPFSRHHIKMKNVLVETQDQFLTFPEFSGIIVKITLKNLYLVYN